MRAEALVVGGGPAGATAARLLAKDHDVLIAEEHPSPGEPMHCAGLVTQRGVPRFAEHSILGTVKGVKFHSPLGYVLTLEGRGSRACVIDRRQFDSILFHRAVDAGVAPMVAAQVRAIHEQRTEVRADLRFEGQLHQVGAAIVVGADGHRSICRRFARLPPPKHMLSGIQVDLKDVDTDPDFVEVFFGRSVAPGFFAWAIPAGDSTRVGLCTWDAENPPAAYLKKLLSRKELSRAFRVRKVFLNLTDKKLDKALRIFGEPKVKKLLEEHGDIDYPASLSSAVLKLAPKLAQFSPQIIESLL